MPTRTTSIQETLDNIKYVAWHDIKHLDTDNDDTTNAVMMHMSARDDMLNYVGSGHAGAIYTLAETAAGVKADSLAQSMDAFILLRGADVKYTQRALGDLAARGFVSVRREEIARQLFSESSRADFSVEVDITDHEDQSVFHGTFNHALRPRK